MTTLDELADVLPPSLRRVWPHVAECARRVGGVLMGGTAVAIHLRHRVSDDLDVMTLRKFSGRALEKRLRAEPGNVDVVEVSDDMFHGFVDGVAVDIFRALPSDGVDASSMRWLARGPEIEGMRIGSLPDLLAAKLDVIRFRPKLRDYLDIAALDRTGACGLEAGLAYYCKRFGYDHPPRALDEIIRLLHEPGTLPLDPAYESRRGQELQHLKARAPALRRRLAELRDATSSQRGSTSSTNS